jgi:hypothetical protein
VDDDIVAGHSRGQRFDVEEVANNRFDSWLGCLFLVESGDREAVCQ